MLNDAFTQAMIAFEYPQAQMACHAEQAHLNFIEEAGHLLKKYVVHDGVKATL